MTRPGAALAGGGIVLLVGTRKGIFRAWSADRRDWTLEGPLLEGYEVYHAVPDPRTPGTAYAAVNHLVWGSHVYRSEDAGRSWEPLEGRPSFPPGTGHRLEAIWHLAPGHPDHPERLWAGVAPAALFRSDDRGKSWDWVRSLEEHPTRRTWQPARGGLFLHSVQIDPRDPETVYAAVSAGGCYRSDDGGASWEPINRGIRAEFLPDPASHAGHNPHALRLHPARPARLYLQDYVSVYRSDDRGDAWVEVTDGLPSGFGYVVGLDPSDPDRCWVIPEESTHMRCVCGGRLRVFETRDAGGTWSPRREGLPQAHAYVSILREALDTDGLRPCGVFFGTSTGHLFGSPDGRAWSLIAGFLPTILSVRSFPLPTPTTG